LLTDRYATLTRFLNDLHVPPLSALAPATEFVLNSELRRQFDNGHVDAERIKSLMEEVRITKAPLDGAMLAYAIKKSLDRFSDEMAKSPEDLDLLHRYAMAASLVRTLPVSVNLWKPQNTYDQLMAHKLPEMRDRADEKSRAWVDAFLALGRQLGFKIEAN
jgi:hypothetical protein